MLWLERETFFFPSIEACYYFSFPSSLESHIHTYRHRHKNQRAFIEKTDRWLFFRLLFSLLGRCWLLLVCPFFIFYLLFFFFFLSHLKKKRIERERSKLIIYDYVAWRSKHI
jgi:hypothetical protein